MIRINVLKQFFIIIKVKYTFLFYFLVEHYFEHQFDFLKSMAQFGTMGEQIDQYSSRLSSLQGCSTITSIDKATVAKQDH